MNANRVPRGRSPSRTRPNAAQRAWGLLVLLLASLPVVAQEPVAAVWQPRKISFTYGSSTTVFSCSALAKRVAVILRAVGARDDVEVRTSGCKESIPPVPVRAVPRGTIGASDPVLDRAVARRPEGRQSVTVYVHLMLPAEATPEVLAELKKDKSRRELVARVTGNPAAKFNDPVMFSAQWQPVTLSRKTIGITTDECELLEQMSPGVFRVLGVRVVRSGFICSPDSNLPPEMVVEALLPAPSPASSGVPATPRDQHDDPGAPAGTGSEADPRGGQPTKGQ